MENDEAEEAEVVEDVGTEEEGRLVELSRCGLVKEDFGEGLTEYDSSSSSEEFVTRSKN
jgi:hypothetical protein